MNEPGVLIVTHNSEGVLGGCLDALAETRGEVLVVDNASQDGTLEHVHRRPGVRLIANPWNRGFAAAVNQGMDALERKCVLVLNPDAVLVRGLDALAEAAGAPGVAAAGGKLVGEDGSPQRGFMVRRFPSAPTLCFEVLGLNRLWPSNPVNRRYRCLDLDPEAAGDVDQPAGAFLMIQREIWRALGGLDESFRPLWFEDVDFCRRAVAEGYRIRFEPRAVAKHSGGHSAKRLDWSNREGYWYGNLLRYAAKHCRRSGVAAVCVAVVLGSLLRSIGRIFLSRSLKPIVIYARVIRLAGSHLFSGPGEAFRLSSVFAGR